MGFAETRWSLVLKAGLDTEEGRTALNALCQEYIGPLKNYLIQTGFNRDSAEEYVQSFFLRLVEKRFVDSADPQKGRFRNFLVMALKRSVAKDLRSAKTIKRGGEITWISMDDSTIVNMHEVIHGQTFDPDQVFHRNWALHLLERSLDLVEKKYRLDGKSQVFETLQAVLAWNSEGLDRDGAAELLGIQPSHLRVLVYRLRRDFRTVVRQQVLETVLDPADIDDEIRELSLAVSGGWKV